MSVVGGHLSDVRNDLSEAKVRGGQIRQVRHNEKRITRMRSGKLGAGCVAVETHNVGDGTTTLCGTSLCKRYDTCISMFSRECSNGLLPQLPSQVSLTAEVDCGDPKVGL